MGSLIPSPLGHGMIKYGNPKGSPPGPGTPKSVIRMRMRQHLDEQVLADILADYQAGKCKSIEVGEFLARYGLGTQTETLDAEKVNAITAALVETFAESLKEHVTDDVARAIVATFTERYKERGQ